MIKLTIEHNSDKYGIHLLITSMNINMLDISENYLFKPDIIYTTSIYSSILSTKVHELSV